MSCPPFLVLADLKSSEFAHFLAEFAFLFMPLISSAGKLASPFLHRFGFRFCGCRGAWLFEQFDAADTTCAFFLLGGGTRLFTPSHFKSQLMLLSISQHKVFCTWRGQEIGGAQNLLHILKLVD